METEGLFAPATTVAVVETYDTLSSAATNVVKELARDLTADASAYDEMVGPETVATAQEALFASLLEVYTGTRTEYEEWCADRDVERIERGNENVANVAWHHAPAAGTVVAATYAQQRDAAVGTLRRQAFASVYRELLEEKR